MSKATLTIIIIICFLMLGVFAFAGFTVFGKIQVEKDKARIEEDKAKLELQVKDLGAKETKYVVENKGLQDKVAELETAKAELEARLKEFDKVNIDELKSKLQGLQKEKDRWVERIEAIRKERDELVEKLKTASAEKEAAASAKQTEAAPAPAPDEDGYWAKVLKEKANLQLELEDLKGKLATSNVELVELKKQAAELQLEISSLKDERSNLQRDVKRGNDLSDTLSLELARAQNDKKFIAERAGKINDENTSLRERIKELTSTKVALEKSIVKVQDERASIEKKLAETENVIQSRVDEMWGIKKEIDESLRSSKSKDSDGIDLPPIVVSVKGNDAEQNAGEAGSAPGFIGNIVSVNEDNNFVIVDIGKTEGLHLGDDLGVYRGAEYVAGLKVIQLREDIAAADITSKTSPIKVGDEVR